MHVSSPVVHSKEQFYNVTIFVSEWSAVNRIYFCIKCEKDDLNKLPVDTQQNIFDVY